MIAVHTHANLLDVSSSLHGRDPLNAVELLSYRLRQCFSKWSVPPPLRDVEEMQGGGRRVRLEWGAYITV
ncbi:hypothetical protein FHG87_008103 [Trinorchestia longiramus]|nr:hypothetical protein FHG87_008103 [Trinorchestia longiramus]